MKKSILVLFGLVTVAGVAIALAAGAGDSPSSGPEAADMVVAGEDFHLVKGIEGFAAFVATQNVEAASISDAESAGAEGSERLAWGQAMLEDLERVKKTAEAGDWALTEDVFAFRDWCIGAAGRGNLLLAIAAEETAATLLFRALAEDQGRGDEVRQRFPRCIPNGLPADYWLETLAMEGIVVDCGDALKATDPEYVRMGTVLETLDAMMGGWGNPMNGPKRDGTWNGCADAFAPLQLAFRTMLIARKKISLEACLDILKWTGSIPEERTAFIDAAEKYARETLSNRNRFTSWTLADDVWKCWAAALAEAEDGVGGGWPRVGGDGAVDDGLAGLEVGDREGEDDGHVGAVPAGGGGIGAFGGVVLVDGIGDDVADRGVGGLGLVAVVEGGGEAVEVVDAGRDVHGEDEDVDLRGEAFAVHVFEDGAPDGGLEVAWGDAGFVGIDVDHADVGRGEAVGLGVVGAELAGIAADGVDDEEGVVGAGAGKGAREGRREEQQEERKEGAGEGCGGWVVHGRHLNGFCGGTQEESGNEGRPYRLAARRDDGKPLGDGRRTTGDSIEAFGGCARDVD